ncbi:MAG: flagellar basal body P-ring formation chaperone FlgA [Bacteroidota bacterium]
MFASILFILSFFTGNSGLEKELQKYIEKYFVSFEKIEFQFAENINTSSKIVIDEDREPRLSKNILLVPVRLISRNKNESKSFITLKVKLYKTVLVAAHDIQKDELLSPEQFKKELKEISLVNGTIFSDENFPAASKSKVRIRENSILVNEMMEKMPDVLPDDRLILHAGRNGVDITTEVISRERGNIGDIIRVISDQRKIFSAKIIDKYNVLLIE